MNDELTNTTRRVYEIGDSLEYDVRMENQGSPVLLPGHESSGYAVSFASAAPVEHEHGLGRDDAAKNQHRSATAYEHTPEQWRAQKETIKHLYLMENLPLKVVMKVMNEEHHFSATERQYKRRFLEWNWKKYNSKGLKNSQLRGEKVSRSSGTKTCRRPAAAGSVSVKSAAVLTQLQQRRQRFPAVQVEFTYANQLDQQIAGLYSGLLDLMNGTSPLHDESRRSAELLCLPSSGTHVVSLFLLSIRLFQAGDLHNGMLTVQRACRSVDNVLQQDGIMVFQSLILEIPFYLLAAERPREMQFFAQHLSLMLSTRKSTHPVTHLARMVQQISMASPESLLYHLGQLYDMTKEQYQDVREESDFVNLSARMNALSLQGSHEGSIIQRYESALDGFAVMLRKARAHMHPEESPTEAIGREFCRIAATSRVAPIPLDPMRAYEKFLDRFLAGEDHSMFLLTQPDPWVLEQYGETKYMMFAHQLQSGDTDAAIQSLRECMEAFECAGADTHMQPLNKYMKNYYVGRALHFRTQLETLLAQTGRFEEAFEVTEALGVSRAVEEVVSSPGDDVVELLL